MDTRGVPCSLPTILFSLALAAGLPTQAVPQGRIDPQLVGEWLATIPGSPVPMVFRLDLNGGCGLEEDVGTCQAQSGTLIFRSSSSGENRYTYKLQGGSLTLSGGDLDEPVVFRRLGGAKQAAQRGLATDESPVPLQPAQEAPQRQAAAGPSNALDVQGAEASQSGTGPRAPRPKRALTEAEVVQLLEGHVPGRRVGELVEERGISFKVTAAVVSRLRAKGATNELIAALRTAEAGQTAGGSSSAKPVGAGGLAALGSFGGSQPVAPARSPVVARAFPAAGGSRHTQDRWGLSFVIPANWQVFERQGVVILKSETEPGIIFLRFMRKVSVQTLSQLYQQGLQEEGLQLTPASQLENFAAGGSQGVAGVLAGMSADGQQLQTRAIGLVSPFGDAVIVLGLTAQSDYPRMKARADALASSFAFTQPKIPPAVDFLAGRYWRYSGSSSYASEAKLNLCGNGTFNQGGESSFGGRLTDSGGNVTATYGGAGQSGSAGQWSAQGDENQGIVTLTYTNGQSEQLEYVVSQDPKDRSAYGPAVSFGGRLYQRAGDGSCGL